MFSDLKTKVQSLTYYYYNYSNKMPSQPTTLYILLSLAFSFTFISPHFSTLLLSLCLCCTFADYYQPHILDNTQQENKKNDNDTNDSKQQDKFHDSFVTTSKLQLFLMYQVIMGFLFAVMYMWTRYGSKQGVYWK